jgi:RNA polymerase sigma-70 factor (ECF subfamily)
LIREGLSSSLIFVPMPPHVDQAKWFADEVHPHDAQLKAYLRGAFPTVRDVDDVVQESYLRVWRSQAEGPIRSARAFLFTVARRLAIDGARRHTASPICAVEDLARFPVVDETVDVAGEVELRERVAILGEAISHLPTRCREVFLLHKIQNLSRRETAERLGLAEKTIEVQTARAMERCGKFLRQREFAGYFSDECA